MTSIEQMIINSLTLIESMVSEGQTDKEIAEKLGISYSTFRRYKKENTDLKAAIAQGKDKKNDNVVKALYKNCVGYHFYEQVPTKIKKKILNDDGKVIAEEEDVKISTVKKYKGPSLDAEKYWLNNRDKTKWKDDPNKVENDKKLTKLKEKEVENKLKDI